MPLTDRWRWPPLPPLCFVRACEKLGTSSDRPPSSVQLKGAQPQSEDRAAGRWSIARHASDESIWDQFLHVVQDSGDGELEMGVNPLQAPPGSACRN
jgi:hypothetical protein